VKNTLPVAGVRSEKLRTKSWIIKWIEMNIRENNHRESFCGGGGGPLAAPTTQADTYQPNEKNAAGKC
jgi:hypothetical protein